MVCHNSYRWMRTHSLHCIAEHPIEKRLHIFKVHFVAVTVAITMTSIICFCCRNLFHKIFKWDYNKSLFKTQSRLWAYARCTMNITNHHWLLEFSFCRYSRLKCLGDIMDDNNSAKCLCHKFILAFIFHNAQSMLHSFVDGKIRHSSEKLMQFYCAFEIWWSGKVEKKNSSNLYSQYGRCRCRYIFFFENRENRPHNKAY